jgi:hypoxanthine phosphoribosyltransferase
VSVARRVEKLPRGLKPLISRVRIARRLPGLAREVHAAIRDGERPIAIVVLQGAFIFAADLLRHFPPDFPIEVAFLRCESYGNGKESSGRVLLLQDVESDVDLRGRTVLLIDDILDTGLTARFLVQHLRKRGAARIVTCVLLRRAASPAAKQEGCFAGFDAGKSFVVGYGLDLEKLYRHVPYLAAFSPRAVRRRRKR